MTIDFTKLLGFDTVNEELSAAVDLQDETFASRLGAKVGTGEMGPSLAEVLAAKVSETTS
jgi:hypothetical protein